MSVTIKKDLLVRIDGKDKELFLMSIDAALLANKEDGDEISLELIESIEDQVKFFNSSDLLVFTIHDRSIKDFKRILDAAYYYLEGTWQFKNGITKEEKRKAKKALNFSYDLDGMIK